VTLLRIWLVLPSHGVPPKSARRPGANGACCSRQIVPTALGGRPSSHVTPASESGAATLARAGRCATMALEELNMTDSGQAHVDRHAPAQSTKSLRCFAHRGVRGHAPENTLLAFDLAFDLGAEAIECDVQRTSDGQLVILHDGTLNRTTDGKGPV